jgi:hypothetical protein
MTLLARASSNCKQQTHRKGSVAKKKYVVVSLKGLGTKTN